MAAKDTTELFLNIETSLTKILEQAKVQTKYVTDRFSDIETSTKRVSEQTDKWGKSLERIKNVAGKIAAGFGILGGFKIVDTIKQTLDLGTAMKDLSFRMGEAGKSAGELRDAAFGVANATGLAVEQASKLVADLRYMRVATKDVKELGILTGQFAKVTGVSADNATRLTAELMRQGRLGVAATKSVLTTMVNVQRAVGLSGAEMDQLNDSIIQSTRALGQYGKTSSQIESFNKGVVKLAGAFSSVGVEVSKATQLIDNLLDPGQIEDNALLLSKMGISIQDALTGNIDPAQMKAGLKGLGQELKGMSNIAANQLAKSMGMSLRDLRSMADMQDDLGEGTKNVADAFKEQLSPQDKIAKAMNSLQVAFSKIADVFTNSPAMEKITSFISELAEKLPDLIDKVIKVVRALINPKTLILIAVGLIAAFLLFKKKLYEGTKQAMVAGVSEGMVQGMNKANAVKAGAPPSAARGAAATTNARVTGGAGFSNIQGVAKNFDAMSKSNLFPSMRNMTSNTAEWLRDISYGTKQTSLLNIKTEENNRKIMDRMRMGQEESFIYKKRLADSRAEKLERIDYLNNVLKKENVEAYEAKRIRAEIAKLGKGEERLRKDINRESESFNKFEIAQIRLLDKYQQKEIHDAMSAEKLKLKSALESSRVRKDELAIERNILTESKMVMETRKKDLDFKIRSKSASVEEVQEAMKLENQLKEIGVSLERNKNDQEDIKEDMRNQNKALLKNITDMKKFQAATGKSADEFDKIRKPLHLSPWQKLTSMIGSKFREAGSNLVDNLNKAKNSGIALMKTLGQKLNPINIARGFMASGRRARAVKAAKPESPGSRAMRGAMGKLGGLLGKLAIPMMIMAAIMPVFQPIIDKVKKGLEKLAPMFTGLVSALIPVVDALIPVVIELVELLLPPLLRVLGLLLVILGYLVKGIASMGKFLMELPVHFNILGQRIQRAIDKLLRKEMSSDDDFEKHVDSQFDRYRELMGIKSPVYKFLNTVEGMGQSLIDAGLGLARGSASVSSTTAGGGGGGSGSRRVYSAGANGAYTASTEQTDQAKSMDLAEENTEATKQMAAAADELVALQKASNDTQEAILIASYQKRYGIDDKQLAELRSKGLTTKDIMINEATAKYEDEVKQGYTSSYSKPMTVEEATKAADNPFDLSF